MPKGSIFSSDLLKLIFNATTIANIAQNATSSPLTSLYISLHTSNPGADGNQTTNETIYGGYARVAVARTTAGWAVTNNVVSPVNNIDFPTCTSGSAILTHFMIGTSASGAGKQLYSGTITPNINISPGYTPRLVTATTIKEL